MPVGSFVRGLEVDVSGGMVHAADPQDATSVCGGLALDVDVLRRSFSPWAPGSCPRCSESLAPTPAPTPPPEPDGPTFRGTG